uniref:Uncharacterized protein n=1 Tax=Trieres chinensis TaxID=1514140 RepID=A0A7S2EE02_TRICV
MPPLLCFLAISSAMRGAVAGAFILPEPYSTPVSWRRCPSSLAMSALPPQAPSIVTAASPPAFHLLMSFDMSSEAGSVFRTAVYAFLGVSVLVAAASTYVTKVAVPDQMAKLAVLVKEQDPDRYADIESRLGEGEKLTDRPDLMGELIDSGMGVVAREQEYQMDALLERVEEHLALGGEVETLREPLEGAFGMTIEEFVEGIDLNAGKAFVTEADVKMAEVLRSELIEKKQADQ